MDVSREAQKKIRELTESVDNLAKAKEILEAKGMKVNAADVPSLATHLNEVASPTNPLGIKAGGEGGTTPAPAVIASAIADALAPAGVTDIPLPATPDAIWRAIRLAARGQATGTSRP
jgi:ABC-type transport system substrate-binding protein